MQGSNRDQDRAISPDSDKACQTILGNIGRTNLLEDFPRRQGFVWDDTLIPYAKHQLPIPKKYRKRFGEEQKKHLPETSQQIQAIFKPADKAAPPHLQIHDISEIFDFGDELGEGTYGTVLKAELSPSYSKSVDAPSRIFAVKRFYKCRGSDMKSPLGEFKNEQKNLERSEKQKHAHLVSFHASFTDEKFFGFITSPVAESNLKSLLEESSKKNVISKEESESLSRAFGCLLEAVRHFHDDLKMKHCDLKPSNILVCSRPGSHFSVRICDLGISYAWDFPHGDSTDKKQRGTQRYKAPEVSPEIDTKHNRMVDIFSLGCIFLEMYTVIKGKTLDEMARVISQDQKSSFGGSWEYAHSLSGVKEWLRELQTDVQSGPREEIIGVITNMLHKSRDDRKEAKELWIMIRSDHNSVGECCGGKSLPALPELPEAQTSRPETCLQYSDSSNLDVEAQIGSSDSYDGAIDYETSIPFKRCTKKSREGFNHHSKSEYKCLEDFPQGGKVKIGKTNGGYVWATTRWIEVTCSSWTEAKEWLPAYYVQARQNGNQVCLEWSNCNQMNPKKGDRHQARRFEKVHLPDRSNLLMEIDFRKDSHASRFCQLLLEDPFKPKAAVELQTPGQKSLVIHPYKWECEDKKSVAYGGKGSRVVYSQNLEPLSLEPFFVPNHFDFTIPLQSDQRHTQLVSKHLWVPEYRSNVRDRYEEPTDTGEFDTVELVRRNEHTFNFEAAFETDYTLGINQNDSLQGFLKSLTGWDPLAIFFATKVHRHNALSSASYDVLCFQKGQEKRIAMRKEHANDKSTDKWTTARLENPQVNTRARKLGAELSAVQRGQFLNLASITAAAGKTRTPSKKVERWSFTVEHGAADVHHRLDRP